MEPTLAGFLIFIRKVMAIPATALPDNSPVIGMAYNVAKTIVNQTLQVVGSADPAYPTIYALAVYNLAGDALVNYAQDVTGSTYFADLRGKLNLGGFVSGVITSSNDESTGQSLVTPEAMANLTFANLQQMKTPWGRAYLSFAQSYGPTIWGIS